VKEVTPYETGKCDRAILTGIIKSYDMIVKFDVSLTVHHSIDLFQ